jgi:hypothetical protein
MKPVTPRHRKRLPSGYASQRPLGRSWPRICLILELASGLTNATSGAADRSTGWPTGVIEGGDIGRQPAPASAHAPAKMLAEIRQPSAAERPRYLRASMSLVSQAAQRQNPRSTICTI